jgi:hypothetical protein
VSWRRWNGWEPRRVTTYAYDEQDRVTAAVTTVEAEWDDEARGFALALSEYEAGLCPACNHPLAETSSAQHEDRYVPGPAIRCHRCTAAEQASKAYQNSPSPGALLIPLEFRPLPPEPKEVTAS